MQTQMNPEFGDRKSSSGPQVAEKSIAHKMPVKGFIDLHLKLWISGYD